MKKPIIVAIDPGKSGATAFRNEYGEIYVAPFIGESAFIELMKSIASSAAVSNVPVYVYIEQVGGYVGKAQPGSTMFNFGDNNGFLRGACLMAEFSVRLVRPQVWQKGLPQTPKLADKSAAKRKHKNELKERAAALFPQFKVTLKNADALLILDYAMRNDAA